MIWLWENNWSSTTYFVKEDSFSGEELRENLKQTFIYHEKYDIFLIKLTVFHEKQG